jgi:hypothetical protein
LKLKNIAGRKYLNENALVVALQQSSLFWWIPTIVPYDMIQKNVVKFFSVLPDRRPKQPHRRENKLKKWTSGVILVVATTLLLLHNGNPPLPFDVSQVKPVLQLFRVDQVCFLLVSSLINSINIDFQQWLLFSNPPKASFWYVIKGELRNDDLVNIFDQEGLAR